MIVKISLVKFISVAFRTGLIFETRNIEKNSFLFS